MKKSIFVVLTVIFMILLLSCDSSKIESDKSVIKEFPYLPSYTNMKIEDFEKSTTKEGLDHASFTVKDGMYTDFLNNYEELLHDNNWQTTDDKKPFSMTLEKEEHIVILVVTSTEEDPYVHGLIYSK
ncbi:hypothetical protein QBE52_12655 [Clostridiaceae bacterium 35-E11]